MGRWRGGVVAGWRLAGWRCGGAVVWRCGGAVRRCYGIAVVRRCGVAASRYRGFVVGLAREILVRRRDDMAFECLAGIRYYDISGIGASTIRDRFYDIA